MKIETMKQKVKIWRINWQAKLADKLAKSIKAYENSIITKPRLDDYYRQIETLIFKNQSWQMIKTI